MDFSKLIKSKAFISQVADVIVGEIKHRNHAAMGPKGTINIDVDTSQLPMARGAQWISLNDKEYRDMMIERAQEGEFIEIAPHLDKFYEFATNQDFKSTQDQRVYFGLEGKKFDNLKSGDEFSALGARSATLSPERAA